MKLKIKIVIEAATIVAAAIPIQKRLKKSTIVEHACKIQLHFLIITITIVAYLPLTSESDQQQHSSKTQLGH